MRGGLAAILLAVMAIVAMLGISCGPQPATQPVGHGQVKPTPTHIPATKPAPAPATADWKQVYKADFSGDKLPAAWEVIGGSARLNKGALLLKADTDSAEVVLKDPVFAAPGVRVSFTATFVSQGEVSDMSPILNTDKDGYPAGYLFQFAAAANSENRIRKEGDIIEESVNTKLLPLKPGRKYQVVAENDGGHLRLTVDGQVVFDHKDDKPIFGEKNGMIGFFTWQSELRIENLIVYGKQAATTATR